MQPDYTILYVDQLEASARLYAGLLGKPAIDANPTFALFAFDNGRMLGLWARSGVKPAPGATDAADANNELAFRLGSEAEVDEAHAAWRERGLAILQAPVHLDFGYTFLAADPDGHRLRVFARSVR